MTERFVKAISVDDVRAGDRILLLTDDKNPILVSACEEVSECTGDYRTLVFEGGRIFREMRGRIVGLVHRPASETRPMQEVRMDILILARVVEDVARFDEEVFSSHIGHLRCLLEEYELGKEPK